MKFKDKYHISPEFESLFAFKSKEEETEHEAKMLMFRFLNELEKIQGDKPLKKKDLAKAIGTSASYITQLYRGDKLINLLTLAKIQDAYGITFQIKAIPRLESYKTEIENMHPDFISGNQLAAENKHEAYITKRPEKT
jgi:transcriptional regulator with XRE-family HTH domain